MAATEAIQDYAKALYALERQSGGEPVSTNALAERMGVAPGSASGMLKRLAEMGLAEHEPYRGARLTQEGRRLALEVLRHHRLLEHVLSEDLEARIAAKLGNPTHDPHGDPIPSAELDIDEGETVSLQDAPAGARGRFVRVSDSDPEKLRYLEEQGIVLGQPFELVDRQPFEGPLTVRFGRDQHVLGTALARAMRVELAT